MATYNFTVRAKDETGAFSDREFNIEVRNTMVDRIVAIDGSNAYSSVDGKTWSTRVGAGGAWVQNLLGKWIVGVNATTYRVSDDTLNWENGLTFTLSNDPAVMGPGATEEDPEVEVTPAGALHGAVFTIKPKSLFEHNGVVYALCSVGGKIGVVSTTDLKEWTLLVSENYDVASNNYMGLENSYISTNLNLYSNLVLHNGQVTIYNSTSKGFLVSEDMLTFNQILASNRSILSQDNIGAVARAYACGLLSVNGLLFISYINRGSNHGNRSYANYTVYSSVKVYYTIDLNNINQGTSNRHSVTRTGAYGDIGFPLTNSVYSNGDLYFIKSQTMLRSNRPTLLSKVTLPNVTLSDVIAFDGDVVVISGGSLRYIDESNGLTPCVATGLPSSGLVSLDAM